MSVFTSYVQDNSPASGQSVEVPKSYEPDTQSEPIFSGYKPLLKSFPASAQAFSPGGTSRIMIPPQSAAYMLGGSSYLSFSVDVRTTCIIDGTGNSSFIATGNNNVFSYFTGGPSKSAAALIDRITLTASNGEVLSDISNYVGWHNYLLIHAANENYRSTSSIQENAFTSITSSNNTQSSDSIAVTVVNNGELHIQIPLALGFFNQKKAFPLWVMSGPLTLSIVWSTAANSIGLSTNVNLNNLSYYPDETNHIWFGNNIIAGYIQPTPISINWSGSRLAFNTTVIEVRPEYINAQRRQMEKGKLLTYSYSTVLGNSYPSTQTIDGIYTNVSPQSVNIGLSCSSLLAVFGYYQTTNSRGVIYDNSTYLNVRVDGSWGWTLGGSASNIELYIDGVPQLNFRLLNSSGVIADQAFYPVKDDTYLPLMDAVGTLFSSTSGSMCKKIFNICKSNAGVETTMQSPNMHDHYRVGNNFHMGAAGQTSFSLPPLWTLKPLYHSGSIYAPNAVAWGLSTRTCNDEGVTNNGTKCSQLQVNFGGTAKANSAIKQAGAHYLFTMFSCTVSFDAYGNIYVRR
jgi:hypothetical protein